MKQITIGTRKSTLALIQSEMVKKYIEDHNPEVEVRLLKMKTTGDKILDRRLDQVGGKGLFVKELDKALLDSRSDLSVHSLKDLPMEVSDKLPVLAYSKRADPRDALVLPIGASELDLSKPIGTSSRRRIVQLAVLYPEARFESVRGNVQTRLNKLDAGEYGGLVLAAAGLKRLGLDNRISRYYEPEEILPAAGQGILAVQGRAGECYDYLKGFADEAGTFAAQSERSFVRELDGGCSSPIAAFARVRDSQIYLTGLYCDEEMKDVRKGEISGPADMACELGIRLAKRLREEV
ncbi:hydroxymethylbilane synthase [Blautia liquoris]|uniref:Porphobilinogen deaminase n=1 Tax=Blautia liquoris TaxID=2779518 RepID=A0A7M2RI26_9FIRM|nr:hydroxymethylbilane synthase [Blautia liquoris]QOV19993.1 hydroxymethylbilane synthase [Blautia liquoris]